MLGTLFTQMGIWLRFEPDPVVVDVVVAVDVDVAVAVTDADTDEDEDDDTAAPIELVCAVLALIDDALVANVLVPSG